MYNRIDATGSQLVEPCGRLYRHTINIYDGNSCCSLRANCVHVIMLPPVSRSDVMSHCPLQFTSHTHLHLYVCMMSTCVCYMQLYLCVYVPPTHWFFCKNIEILYSYIFFNNDTNPTFAFGKLPLLFKKRL